MNIKDSAYNRYHLCKEMYDTIDLIKSFDKNISLNKAIKENIQSIFITGEGSSRLVPGKNIIEKNMRNGMPLHIYTEGASQALEYNLEKCLVIGLSNSGRTKELVRLFDQLLLNGHEQLIGITANSNTLLEEKCKATHILNCGKEKAVAATKSVVEQSMVLEALYCSMTGIKMLDLEQLSQAFQSALDLKVDPETIDTLVKADTIYFAGRNNGIAEELTLKTNEIARKKSDFLEGTYGVHGIEEVMNKKEALILIDPFPDEEAKFKEVIQENIGMSIISIASRDTMFKTIRIPEMGDNSNYIQLAAGWNLLVEIALASGIDPDKPERARKVGNEFISQN